MIKFSALLIALFMVVVAVALSTTGNQQQKLREIENSPDRGTLKWYAEVAKLKGESQITKPAPVGVVYVDNIKDLDTALRTYDVIIAELIENRTFIQNYESIVTYNKFRVVENLSQKELRRCSDCDIPDSIPAEMLPIQPDEILIATGGGSVSIDGVEVTAPSEITFEPSKKYLVFLEVDKSGTLGRIIVGPGGVFKVNSDEKLVSITNREHPLKRFVKRQGDSLRQFKNEAERQKTLH